MNTLLGVSVRVRCGDQTLLYTKFVYCAVAVALLLLLNHKGDIKHVQLRKQKYECVFMQSE